MNYKARNLPQIKADFESGKFTKMDVSKKWRMSRQTLRNIEIKFGWQFSRNGHILDTQIERLANQKSGDKEADKLNQRIFQREANKLLDYSDELIKNIKALDVANKANLKSYILELKRTDGNLPKSAAEKYRITQQFLKLSAETFRINFETIRQAMGIRSPDAPTMKLAISIEHMKDFDKLTDLELSNILATDEVHAPTTINELAANT